MKNQRNAGFDGRTFLTEEEWMTYCRRKPVRYINKQKDDVCRACGEPATADNVLQNAHLISFDIGVIELALTPDFLDSDTNIVTAHRIACNKGVELDLSGSMERLRSLGIVELPAFLPSSVQEMWREVVDTVRS